jgi:hypothetical protein
MTSPTRFQRIATLGVVTATVAPLLLYGAARQLGHLTTADDWYRGRGMNHGPWRWEIPGLLILACLYFLIAIGPVAVTWGLWRRFGTPQAPGLAWSVRLALLSLAALSLLMAVTFWTID